MAETVIEVESFEIGASAKFQVLLENPFSSYTDIIATIESVSSDAQVISKNSKVVVTGFKPLTVDPSKPKAFWVYIEANESQKAYKGLYVCRLELLVPDTSYPSGTRTEKITFPVINFV